MADTLSRAGRSRLMARIRSSGTGPERALEAALARLGLRPARQTARLPGTPDLAFPAARLAVFVHGCFWHGCRLHYRAPRSRRAFWRAKLLGNVARDRRAARSLRRGGWAVLVVWEHEVRASPLSAAARVARKVGRGRFK